MPSPQMMLGVCKMLGTPYLGRVGGTAHTLSPPGGVALAVTCLVGADEMTASMIITFSPLLSLGKSSIFFRVFRDGSFVDIQRQIWAFKDLCTWNKKKSASKLYK
jgi:hypothetical protein